MTDNARKRDSFVFADYNAILTEHRKWLESGGADGERANLDRAFLYQAALEGALLWQAHARHAFLSEAQLGGADLSDCDLTEATLEEADLAGANLRDAILIGANLSNARLTNADLSGADLSGAVLSGADLAGANLANAQGLTRDQLGAAKLAGATLPEAIGAIEFDVTTGTTISETAEAASGGEAAPTDRRIEDAATAEPETVEPASHDGVANTGHSDPALPVATAAEAAPPPAGGPPPPPPIEPTRASAHSESPPEARGAAPAHSTERPGRPSLDDIPIYHVDDIAPPPAPTTTRPTRTPEAEAERAIEVERATLYTVYDVNQSARRVGVLLLATMTLAAYSWLTVGTTTDAGLLSGSAPSSMPILGTSVPAVGFYMVAVAVLFVLYALFLMRLKAVCVPLGRLPSVFTDGEYLDQKINSWVLKGLLRTYQPLMQVGRSWTSQLHAPIIVLITWWLVPLTLYFVWARYLPRHDAIGTGLHLVLLTAALWFSFGSYGAIGDRLRKERKPVSSRWSATDMRLYSRGAAALGIIVLAGLSTAAMVGWAPVVGPFGSPLQVALQAVGYRPYAVLAAEPPAGQDDAGATLLAGADLSGYNLRFMRADSALLARSVLQRADLRGAYLSYSNLAEATLSNASLTSARLRGARLRDATLASASLDSAELDGADLRGSDLRGASLSGIRGWREIGDIERANLHGARFPPPGFLDWAFAHGAVCIPEDAVWSAVRGREAARPAGRPRDLLAHCEIDVAPPSAPVVAVEITPSADTAANPGAVIRFAAVARDASANPVANAMVRWRSSDTTVATIDGTGAARAVGPGRATITAAAGDRSTTASLVVAGDRPAPATPTPTPTVATGFTAGSVDAGSWHTCSVAQNGDAYCWGFNFRGQLGAAGGPVSNQLRPARVTGGLRFRRVASGHESPATHTCGVTVSGDAYCWGSNERGRLGAGQERFHATPQPIPELKFTAVSTGLWHSCGVTTENAAYCWGGNFLGALGNGTETDAQAPTPVSGNLPFAAISAGESFTCALTPPGRAYCWGTNREGQLGIGTLDRRGHRVPEPVQGALTFRSISAGAAHACGVTSAGVAYCWGNNASGQLGTGDTTAHAAPTQVVGSSRFRSVSAGGGHSCGITTEGAAYCWGRNASGQLGNGGGGNREDSRATPAAVAGGLTFRSVSAGLDHTCGVVTSGEVYCWGLNDHAQLGWSARERCSGLVCAKTPGRVSRP